MLVQITMKSAPACSRRLATSAKADRFSPSLRLPDNAQSLQNQHYKVES